MVKKKYITPACTAFSVRTMPLLGVSMENEYSNNQGHVHFESSSVAADDAD
ncbi:MAG: hypothetical protein IJ200_12105 [Prevotella sp.]|nr:hypothetical protein [Prevotella sp.]